MVGNDFLPLSCAQSTYCRRWFLKYLWSGLFAAYVKLLYTLFSVVKWCSHNMIQWWCKRRHQYLKNGCLVWVRYHVARNFRLKSRKVCDLSHIEMFSEWMHRWIKSFFMHRNNFCCVVRRFDAENCPLISH